MIEMVQMLPGRYIKHSLTETMNPSGIEFKCGHKIKRANAVFKIFRVGRFTKEIFLFI